MHGFEQAVLLLQVTFKLMGKVLFSDYLFITYNNNFNNGFKPNQNFVIDEAEFFYVILDTNKRYSCSGPSNI